MNLLLLHAATPADDCRAWLSGEGGLAEIGHGTIAHFATLHPASPCVLFLPSSSCLFASATVSAKQLRQAQQSLAWLIEEQSGEDVEDLHVIAGPAPGELTPLIAISRADLEAWLVRLRSAGLRPLAVVPDLFLVAQDDSDWQLAVRGGLAFLRTGQMQGAVLEADALELMLDAALRERPHDGALAISVAAPSPEAATRVEEWAGRHEGISVHLAESADPASALAAVPDWTLHPANLLQGEFAPRSRFQLGGGLRMAAAFVGAAFALQLASEWLHLAYYRYQGARVAERVVATYRSAYPGERLPSTTTSALREVEKRMRGRRNDTRNESGNVLPVLTRVAGSLQGSGLSTQRVDIAGGVLTLDVQARSLGELDGLKQKLDQQGLPAEIVSANAQGGLIRGRLRVEGGV